MPSRRHLLAALLLLGLVAALPGRAAASPLRISVECQGWGRTKACPAFLLGFIEHDPLFQSSPRGDAQVVLYYNVTEVANLDRVHLRFVGSVAGAPPVVEAQVELDTRSDDDAQRAQLEPAFLRGAALYVAALHPEAVTITLTPAPEAVLVAPATSPWGFEATLGGYGSWTRGYQSASTWGNAGVSRITGRSALSVNLGGSWGVTRQPPLIIEGEEISLDTDQYALNASAFAERHLDDHWAIGALSSVWHEDPEGQYRVGWQGRAGIEWDKFHADDPRGNRLALTYLAGWQVDRYNVPNVLGERLAQYPIHGVSAGGNVRHDKIGVGLSLVMRGEVLRPMRRHTLSASPYIELQLGAHVDLSLSLSVTKRALPATDVDDASFEQITRASYAEPLSAYGSFSLRFHWDRSNGQRNDRFGDSG